MKIDNEQIRKLLDGHGYVWDSFIAEVVREAYSMGYKAAENAERSRKSPYREGTWDLW